MPNSLVPNSSPVIKEGLTVPELMPKANNIDIIHISGQRDLGVNDDLATLVQVKDHIGAHDRAVVIAHRLPVLPPDNGLRVVMHALGKAL